MSAHEALSLVEFQLRLLTFIALRAHQECGGGKLSLPRSLGMGSLLAALRQIAKDGSLERRFRSIADVVEAALERFYSIHPGAGARIENFKLLRDHLMHAGPLPTAEVGDQVSALCRSLAADLGSLIAPIADGFTKQSRAGSALARVSVAVGAEPLSLWPLIVGHDDDQLWRVYSTYSDGTAWFNIPGSPEPRQAMTDEHLIEDLLGRYLREPTKDNMFADFVSAVRRDLAALSAPRAEPLHWEEHKEFTMMWFHAAPASDELRHDDFRIGPSDTRQWRDPSSQQWIPYSEFLRGLVNWPVLRDRLREVVLNAEAEEQARMQVRSTYVVPPRFREYDLSGVPHENSPISANDLITEIDELASVRGASTCVVFVQGPAGIGKTKSLRYLARTSMTRTRDDGRDEGPLYLYVQTSGVSLMDLDQVVSAAVTNTRLLTTDSVKMLARNGLLVVVIDGLDELLGGRSYDASISALRPWLDALGGRGVLVVSARSAYFLQHYRKDLVSAVSHGAVNVTHRVYHIDQWLEEERDNFVQNSGLDPLVFRRFDKDEQELLRLPFFVSVVADAIRDGGGLPEGSTVASLLVGRYIAREASKLGRGSIPGQSMLTSDELLEFFTEVAELLAEAPERGVDVGLIELAGAIAIAGDLDDRPGLAKRLTVLCGLEAVESGGDAGARLAFGHELYFDYFVARALGRALMGGNHGRATDLMSLTVLRPWAAELIVSEFASVGLVHSYLEATVDRRASHEMQTLRASAGPLYSAILQRADDLIPGWIAIKHIRAETLELKDLRRELPILLEECAIEEFRIGATAGGSRLRMERCDVTTMSIQGAALSFLELDSCSVPVTLTLRHEFHDRPADIIDRLRVGGVSLLGDRATWPEVDDESGEAVFSYFLQKLIDGGAVSPVVEVASRLPNDDRLKWANASSDDWRRFVNALETSGVAKLQSIQASGPKPMARIKFKYALHDLTNLSSEDSAIRSFWDLA